MAIFCTDTHNLVVELSARIGATRNCYRRREKFITFNHAHIARALEMLLKIIAAAIAASTQPTVIP